VGAEIARALDHFGVPEREKQEVLAAIVARKAEVVNPLRRNPHTVTPSVLKTSSTGPENWASRSRIGRNARQPLIERARQAARLLGRPCPR
jgi:hypothetical protein